MKVKVTKENVIVTEYDNINQGEVGVHTCFFEFPECFDGLSVTASFNNIPIPIFDNKCSIPTLKKGTVVLGVYAYTRNDGAVTLMYSPKPTVFYVDAGSYTGETAVEETPEIGDFEQYCRNFASEILESIENEVQKEAENKQDILVSGENIKTINGESLLGSGDITLEGGSADAELRGDVTAAIGETTRYKDITADYPLKVGGYNATNGKYNSLQTTGQCTEIFPVTKGEKYRVTGYATYYYCILALYDENKAFIKSFSAYEIGTTGGTVEYTIPETETDENGNEKTVAYIACSSQDAPKVPLTIEKEVTAFNNVQDMIDTSLEALASGSSGGIVLSEDEKLACERFSNLFISTSGRTESLVFFTDPHLCTSTGVKSEFEATMDRIMAVYNNIPVSTCVCGGDWLSTGNTKENAAYLLGKIDGAMKSRFKNYINLAGNHDTNYMGYEYTENDNDRQQSSNCIITNTALSNLWYRNHGGNYFAVDGDCTRFYVFDTGIDDWVYVHGVGVEGDWYTETNGYTSESHKNEQIHWFANSLLADNPERCAILLHVGTKGYVATPFVSDITAVAKAFNDKTSITFNEVTYDFSKTEGHLYFALAGHAHVDLQLVENSIPVVLTTNLYYEYSDEYPPSYDLVLADYGANVIKLVRVGAENSYSTDDFDENSIRTFQMA